MISPSVCSLRLHKYDCCADGSLPPTHLPPSTHLGAHEEHTESRLLQVFSGIGKRINRGAPKSRQVIGCGRCSQSQELGGKKTLKRSLPLFQEPSGGLASARKSYYIDGGGTKNNQKCPDKPPNSQFSGSSLSKHSSTTADK